MIEQAARLHHRSVAIDPFENGNGRWSRMLANIWLKSNGDDVVRWPEEMIGEPGRVRQAYLAAIRKADHEDYDVFIEFHRRFQG